MIEQGIHGRTDEAIRRPNGEVIPIGHGYLAVSPGFGAVKGPLGSMVREFPARLGDALGRWPRVLSKYALALPGGAALQVLQQQTYVASGTERGYNLVHQYAAVGEDCEPDFVRYPLAWMMAAMVDRPYSWRDMTLQSSPGIPAVMNFPMPPLSQLLPAFGMDLAALENLLCAMFDAVQSPQVYCVVLFDDGREDYEILVRQLLVYIYTLLPYSMRRACGFESWLTGSMDSAFANLYFASYRYWQQYNDKNYIYVDMQNSLDVTECFLFYGGQLLHRPSKDILQERSADPASPYRRFIHPWLERLWDPRQCFNALNQLNDTLWADFDAAPAGRGCLTVEPFALLSLHQQLREGALPVPWQAFPDFSQQYLAAMGTPGDQALAWVIQRQLERPVISPEAAPALLQLLTRQLSGGEATLAAASRLFAVYFQSHPIGFDQVPTLLSLQRKGLLRLGDDAWQLLFRSATQGRWDQVDTLLTLVRAGEAGDAAISPEIAAEARAAACAALPDRCAPSAAGGFVDRFNALSDETADACAAALLPRLELSLDDAGQVLRRVFPKAPGPLGRAALLDRLPALRAVRPLSAAQATAAVSALCALLPDGPDRAAVRAAGARAVQALAAPLSRQGADLLLEALRPLADAAPMPEAVARVLETAGEPFPAPLGWIVPELSREDCAPSVLDWLADAPLPDFGIPALCALVRGVIAAASPVREALHGLLLKAAGRWAIPCPALSDAVSAAQQLPEDLRESATAAMIDALQVEGTPAFFDAVSQAVADVELTDGMCARVADKLSAAASAFDVDAPSLEAVSTIAAATGSPHFLPILERYYRQVKVSGDDPAGAARELIALNNRLKATLPNTDAVTLERLCALVGGGIRPFALRSVARQTQEAFGDAALDRLMDSLRVDADLRQDYLEPALEWSETGSLPKGALEKLVDRWLPLREDWRLSLAPDQLLRVSEQRAAGNLPMDEVRFVRLCGQVRLSADSPAEDLLCLCDIAESAPFAGDAAMARARTCLAETGIDEGEADRFLELCDGNTTLRRAEGLEIAAASLRADTPDARERGAIWALRRAGSLSAARRLLTEGACVTDAEAMFRAVEGCGMDAVLRLMPAAIDALRPDAASGAQLKALSDLALRRQDVAGQADAAAARVAEAIPLIDQLECAVAAPPTSKLWLSFRRQLLARTDNPGFGDLALARVADRLVAADGTVEAPLRQVAGWMGNGPAPEVAVRAVDLLAPALARCRAPEGQDLADGLARILDSAGGPADIPQPQSRFEALEALEGDRGKALASSYLGMLSRSIYTGGEAVGRDAPWLNGLLRSMAYRDGAAACFCADIRPRLSKYLNVSHLLPPERLWKMGKDIADPASRGAVLVEAAWGVPGAAEALQNELWRAWSGSYAGRGNAAERHVPLLSWLVSIHAYLERKQPGDIEAFRQRTLSSLLGRAAQERSVSAFVEELVNTATGLQLSQADVEKFVTALLQWLESVGLGGRDACYDEGLMDCLARLPFLDFLKLPWQHFLLGRVRLLAEGIMRDALTRQETPFFQFLRVPEDRASRRRGQLLNHWSAYIARFGLTRQQQRVVGRMGFYAMCGIFAQAYQNLDTPGARVMFMPLLPEAAQSAWLSTLPAESTQLSGAIALMILSDQALPPDDAPTRFPGEAQPQVRAAMPTACDIVRNFCCRFYRQLAAAAAAGRTRFSWTNDPRALRFTLEEHDPDATCMLVDAMFTAGDYGLLTLLEQTSEDASRAYLRAVNTHIREKALALPRGSAPAALMEYLDKH